MFPFFIMESTVPALGQTTYVSDSELELCATGWVGIVWSKENSLINMLHSCDRPASLLILANYLKLALY